MRHRLTYIQNPSAPYSPSQTTLTRDALHIDSIDAAREERITLGFDEVPAEVWSVLRQTHEVHIRWSREGRYEAISPMGSRVSPGLHVFYSPLVSAGKFGVGVEGEAEGSRAGIALCTLLRKVFDDGLDCQSAEKSFITQPVLSTRFASTAAYQYHSLLPTLTNLAAYIEQKICTGTSATATDEEECDFRTNLLLSADSLDINYDSISHAVTVSAFWAEAPGVDYGGQRRGQGKGWTEIIRKNRGGAEQVEVGLLGAEQANDVEEIKMGGLLGVVGRDEEMKPTLFSFPSRHHTLPTDATYTVSFNAPTGLHPEMTISLSSEAVNEPPARPDASCALHTYLTLPSSIFGDKYQLSTSDPLFLKSHSIAALRAVSGETDLEAPDWSVSRWGSTWLLELASPLSEKRANGGNGTWNVTIPLHLRYLHPFSSGYRPASIPWPVVFWACTAEDGTKMGVNPFDRVNLGWEGLFGPRTMFYQVHPAPVLEDGLLVEKIDVPVLALDERDGFFSSQVIKLGTVAIISLGFLWVLWKLGLVAQSNGIRPQGRAADKGSKAQ
ncbi:PIG-X [Aspergillus venezuelensis]